MSCLLLTLVEAPLTQADNTAAGNFKNDPQNQRAPQNGKQSKLYILCLAFIFFISCFLAIADCRALTMNTSHLT